MRLVAHRAPLTRACVARSIRSLSMMQAIQVEAFGDPSVMQVAQLPVPEPKEATDVVVKLMAAGVNPVDTYLRAGQYAKLPQLPYIPGKDGAGVVHAVGPSVNRWCVGDRVFVTSPPLSGGTYAQYALVTEDGLHTLPRRCSYAQGAAVYIAYTTAYHALFQRCEALPGDTVLVHGASGGVGLAAVQLAVAAGMRVLGTSSTPEGRELVAAQGATHVFDHSEVGYMDKVIAASPGGAGVNVVLEMLANRNLDADMDALCHGGRIGVIGNRGTIDGVNCRKLMGKRAAVIGVALGTSTAEEQAQALAYVEAGLASGALSPITGKSFTMSDAPAAHVEIMTPTSATLGKMILHLWPQEGEEGEETTS